MQRYALKIEYHGAPFVGWQRQIDLASVQGAIEDALAKIEPRAHNIAAAGRTDAGVHALAQVAHCDMERDWTPFRLSEAINYHLKPLPIAIVDCVAVDDDFHARFSALERRYLFRVLVRRPPATHQAGLVWQVKKPLDIDRMREAATHLIGEHDFTTFRSVQCQADSPVRSLDRLDVIAGGTEGLVEIHAAARSFLHNQIRSFAGTLRLVGEAKWSADDVEAALLARSRKACGPVAPPEGLCFRAVEYPLS